MSKKKVGLTKIGPAKRGKAKTLVTLPVTMALYPDFIL